MERIFEQDREGNKPVPADFVFKSFMALAMLNLVASWLFSLAMLAGDSNHQYMNWEAEAQRSSIHRRIWDPLYRIQRVDPMDGELTIYTHCFYAYALVSICVSHPSISRKDILAELEQIIAIVQKASSKRPLDGYQKLKPAGGIIPVGNINLVRAGYALLGGTNLQILSDFHSTSKQLYDEFEAAQVPFLESAPEMIWPNDNCAALESLHLHDTLYRTSYDDACVKAERWLKEHVDPENGMMNIQIDKLGRRLDVPRGCGLSWSLAFMPGFAPDLAKQQYDQYREKWFVPVFGTYGIREWWPGQENKSLIPSGPVIANIGWAASGLGIAAAHENGDREGCLGLLRGLDLLGFPNINVYGQKSYCGELFLLADVMALWAKTTCAWDQPQAVSLWQAPPTHAAPTGSFLSVWIVAALCGCLFVFSLICEAKASWKQLKMTLPITQWPSSKRLILSIQCLMALVVFVVPVFIWPVLVFLMLILKFSEKAIINKKVPWK